MKGDGRWLWCTDSGTWVGFSDAINDKLEEGIYKGDSRVKVDDQRFVDLVHLLQRRYDDENRCRNVKREVIQPFEMMVFFLVGKEGSNDFNARLKLIDAGKGLVSQFICPKVCDVPCFVSSVAQRDDCCR